MTPIEKAEKQAEWIKEYRVIEFALHLIDRALQHEAKIWTVRAEDDALAERSVEVAMTKDESAAVFKCMREALRPRLKALEGKLS